MATLTRKDLEREFHNTREVARKADPENYTDEYSNKKFYKITQRSKDYIQAWLEARCNGKKVLDYCCGTGETSKRLAGLGANVVGIDLADECIETCKEDAIRAGMTDKMSFFVMDSENTTFEDSTFDVIVCAGVLHHLDLDAAYKELSRILKPTGEILCIEALAHNPIIHWYRRRTPELRTAWEVDHILSVPSIKRSQKHFDGLTVKYFHLAAIAAVWFVGKPGFKPLLGILNLIDDVILSFPWVNKQAWQAVFTLSKPKKYSK